MKKLVLLIILLLGFFVIFGSIEFPKKEVLAGYGCSGLPCCSDSCCGGTESCPNCCRSEDWYRACVGGYYQGSVCYSSFECLGGYCGTLSCHGSRVDGPGVHCYDSGTCGIGCPALGYEDCSMSGGTIDCDCSLDCPVPISCNVNACSNNCGDGTALGNCTNKCGSNTSCTAGSCCYCADSCNCDAPSPNYENECDTKCGQEVTHTTDGERCRGETCAAECSKSDTGDCDKDDCETGCNGGSSAYCCGESLASGISKNICPPVSGQTCGNEAEYRSGYVDIPPNPGVTVVHDMPFDYAGWACDRNMADAGFSSVGIYKNGVKLGGNLAFNTNRPDVVAAGFCNTNLSGFTHAPSANLVDGYTLGDNVTEAYAHEGAVGCTGNFLINSNRTITVTNANPAVLDLSIDNGVGQSCLNGACNGRDIIVDQDLNNNRLIRFTATYTDVDPHPAYRTSDIRYAYIVFDNDNNSDNGAYLRIRYEDMQNSGTGAITLYDNTSIYNNKITLNFDNVGRTNSSWDEASHTLTVNATIDVSGINDTGSLSSFLSNVYLRVNDFAGVTTDRSLKVGSGDFSSEVDACGGNSLNAIDMWNGTNVVVRPKGSNNGDVATNPFNTTITSIGQDLSFPDQYGPTVETILPFNTDLTFRSKTQGVYVQASDFSLFNNYTRTSGASVDVYAWRHYNGAIGAVCDNIPIEMQLLVDNALVQTWSVTDNEPSTFSHNFGSDISSDRIRVRFNNDCYASDPASDTNLMIESVTLAGLTYDKTALVTDYDSTHGSCQDGLRNQNNLNCDGSFLLVGNHATTNGLLTDKLLDGGVRQTTSLYGCKTDKSIYLAYQDVRPVSSMTFGTGDGDTLCTDANCGGPDEYSPKDWMATVDTNNNTIVSGTIAILDMDSNPTREGIPVASTKKTDITYAKVSFVDQYDDNVPKHAYGSCTYSEDINGNQTVTPSGMIDECSFSPAIANSGSYYLNLSLRVNLGKIDPCQSNYAQILVETRDFAGLWNNNSVMASNVLLNRDQLSKVWYVPISTGNYLIPSGTSFNVRFNWLSGGVPGAATVRMPAYGTESCQVPLIIDDGLLTFWSLNRGYYVSGSDFRQVGGTNHSGVTNGIDTNTITQGSAFYNATVYVRYEDHYPTIHNFSLGTGTGDTSCTNSSCNNADLCEVTDNNNNRIISGTVNISDYQNSPLRQSNPDISLKNSDIETATVTLKDHYGNQMGKCTYFDDPAAIDSNYMTSDINSPAVLTNCEFTKSGTNIALSYRIDLSRFGKGLYYTSGDMEVVTNDYAGATRSYSVSNLTFWNCRDIPLSLNANSYGSQVTDPGFLTKQNPSTYTFNINLPSSCSYDYSSEDVNVPNSSLYYVPYYRYGGTNPDGTGKCQGITFKNANANNSGGYYLSGNNASVFGGLNNSPTQCGGVWQKTGCLNFNGLTDNYFKYPYTSNNIFYLFYEDYQPQINTSSFRFGTGTGDTLISGTSISAKDLIVDIDTNHNQIISGSVVILDRDSTNDERDGYPTIPNKSSDIADAVVYIQSRTGVAQSASSIQGLCRYSDNKDTGTTPTYNNTTTGFNLASPYRAIMDCTSFSRSGTALTLNFEIKAENMTSCTEFLGRIGVAALDFAQESNGYTIQNLTNSVYLVNNLRVWNGKDMCIVGGFYDLDAGGDLCVDDRSSLTKLTNDTALILAPEYSRVSGTWPTGTWSSTINQWQFTVSTPVAQPYYYYNNLQNKVTYDFLSRTTDQYITALDNRRYGGSCDNTVNDSRALAEFNSVEIDANYSDLGFGLRQFVDTWLQVNNGHYFIDQGLEETNIPEICADCYLTNFDIAVSDNNGLVITNNLIGEVHDRYGFSNNYRAEKNTTTGVVPFSSRNVPTYNEILTKFNEQQMSYGEAGSSKTSDLKDGSGNFLHKVYFIDGDLEIDEDNFIESGSYVAFVVSGNITVDQNVHNVDGIYIGETITVNDDGTPNYDASDKSDQLVVNGSFAYIDQMDVYRTLGAGNSGFPPVIINLRPDMVSVLIEENSPLVSNDLFYLGEKKK